MRTTPIVAIALLATCLPPATRAQDDAEAPAPIEPGIVPVLDDMIPKLFAPGSISVAFANQNKDPAWATSMESRIVDAISGLENLRFSRMEADCRRTMCAVLVVYDDDGDRKTDIANELRKKLAFGGVRAERKQLADWTVAEIVLMK